MVTLKEKLMNKKAVFFGDSITLNWIKYDHDHNELTQNKNNEKYEHGNNYVGFLNDECHFKSIHNFGVSGGCYSNCADIVPVRQEFRHFPIQVSNAIEAIKEAEVIFVMFGTNDYSEQIRFGDYTDLPSNPHEKNMSFYGGMNYGFHKIREVNPTAPIYVINILNRVLPVETQKMYCFSYHEYNLAIAHTCRLLNLNLIDVSKEFKIVNDSLMKNGIILSNDGLHPNVEGHKVLANAILNHQVND